jgi:4-amino-4-deoxy-L-arabinose transferase-like glycosyltransferase
MALESGDWSRTFMHHPGVTFMWLSGLFMKVGGELEPPIGLNPTALILAKLPGALLGSILAPASYLLLRKILGRRRNAVAAIAGLFMVTEPFLVAHSRSMHLDTYVTSLTWLGILTALLALRKGSWRWAIASGVLVGFAVLSKVAAGPAAVGLALFFVFQALWPCPKKFQSVALIFLLGTTALFVFFFFWPAMLYETEESIQQLLKMAKKEVGAGHRIFALGKIHRKDPGIIFYVAAFALRTSPEILLALPFGVWIALKRRGAARWAFWGIAVSYLPVFFTVVTSPKKGDRYLLMFFPFMCLLAAYAWQALAETLRKKWPWSFKTPVGVFTLAILLIGVLGTARVARLVKVHPLPITWYATVPGWAPEETMTLGWGEGFKEVALFIRDELPKKSRARVYAGQYIVSMKPWVHYRPVHPKKAHYIVDYISDYQRRIGHGKKAPYIKGKKPLHVVEFNGIEYARIYAGPDYEKVAAGRKKQEEAEAKRKGAAGK